MNSNQKRPNARPWMLSLAIILIALTSEGQVGYKQSGPSKVAVSGTSTMHDWTMTSGEATYDAVFESNALGNPVRLTALLISLPAESLKSGKGAMDKNAYTALRTDSHKQITFQLTNAKMDSKTIKCTGKLTIAGTTKPTDVEATCTIRDDNSLQCTGSKKIIMTDFNVEPPSFMFGSVKTGNEITVSFEVILAPKKPQPTTRN